MGEVECDPYQKQEKSEQSLSFARMPSWERWRRPIMEHIPISVPHLRLSLQAPMGFIFIRQETYEGRGVRACVSIMIREVIVTGMALILQGSAIQEIWETLQFVRVQKRSHATMI
jgi:hypothetical protein